MSDTSGRQSKRTPVTLKIKFKSATLDQFIERYSVDVSQGGIFIRTKDPLAVGTQLRFEFQLQDASPLIAGEGTVVWTREFDPSRVGVAPGMGVRFDKLGPESLAVLDRILAQKNKDVVEPKFDGPPSQAATKVTPPGLAGTLAAQARAPQGAPASRPAVAAQRAATTTASPPPVHKQTMLGYAAAERPVPRVGHLAPPRGGFPEEPSKDATPLPKPMPFHAVADDDFTDDVFDQPTKVASVENLLKQEEEQARAARGAEAMSASAAVADGGSGPAHGFDDDEGEVKTHVRKKPLPAAASPGAAAGEPTPQPGRPEPRLTPMGMAAQEAKHDDEPRFLKENRPLARPSSPKPAVFPPAAPKSSWLPIALVVALGLIGAAVAIYLFVIKPSSEEPAPRTRPTTAALSPVGETVKPATSPPATEAAPPTAAATPTATPTTTIDVDVTSTPPGASVELDGKANGTTPTKLLGLAPDKTYKVVVRAACFKDASVDLSPQADSPVDVKLAPLDRVLRVTTDPANARVAVNGKAMGTAPTEVKLAGAPVRVRASLPGYAVSEAAVPTDAPCVTDGEVGVVAVKLTLAKAAAEAAAAPQRPVAREAKGVAKKPPKEPAAKASKEAKAPKGTKAGDKAVIVSPLQPLPSVPAEPKPPPQEETAPPPAPKEASTETPPPAPVKEPPAAEVPPVPVKEPAKETPPKETHAPKEKIQPPKEQPLPNKECDPSPDAPEWARCK